jgi:hypothetical protein
MSKVYRIFESHQAPAALSLPISPWHYEGLVKIPEENWQVIELAARKIDNSVVQDFFDLLQSSAERTNVNLSSSELENYIEFFRNLQIKIQDEKILDSIDRNELVDDFYDEEYIRMLDSLIAILKEAKASHRGFKTWFD